MEGVALLHEVFNKVHKIKYSGILFQIDFEKTLDEVKWSFLLKVLEVKGFPHLFNHWVMKTVYHRKTRNSSSE
jgi:uncharacterized protein (DUF952 family)